MINVLNSATRPHHYPTGGDDVAGMITGNTQEVLAFYKSLVPTADFQVVQEIEGLSYWVYYHAPNDQVKRDALAIEQAIAGNAEYQIYKTLIGFEGIFLSWEDLRRNDSYWEETDKFRREKASEFANSINAGNFQMWRARILSYAKTESKIGRLSRTSTTFLRPSPQPSPSSRCSFSLRIQRRSPGFTFPCCAAFGTVRNSRHFERLELWIAAGQFLYASTKQFLDCPALDQALVKRLLARAVELNDLNTVALVMSVAASNVATTTPSFAICFCPRSKYSPNAKTHSGSLTCGSGAKRAQSSQSWIMRARS